MHRTGEGGRARDPWRELAAAIRVLGVMPEPGFVPRARTFLGELQRWNTLARLTGYQTEREQVCHLVLESLLLLRVVPTPASPLLDIGSGPGVPGLVLKLARPAWRVSLVEANRRRANFLRHVIRALGLEGIGVHAARAESLTREPDLQGGFQTVTLRAVAAPAEAAGLARPFLAATGHAVISLGPGMRPTPPGGTVREVPLPARMGLPVRRRFLIIRATEIAPDVSRGTRGRGGTRLGRGQPEGGRR